MNKVIIYAGNWKLVEYKNCKSWRNSLEHQERTGEFYANHEVEVNNYNDKCVNITAPSPSPE